MKEKFRELISEVFHHPWINNVENFDDIYYGFEFNPEPTIMIQVKISHGSKQHIEGGFMEITKHKMDLYSKQLISRTIFSGKTIFTPDGDPNYDFYRLLFLNYNSF